MFGWHPGLDSGESYPQVIGHISIHAHHGGRPCNQNLAVDFIVCCDRVDQDDHIGPINISLIAQDHHMAKPKLLPPWARSTAPTLARISTPFEPRPRARRETRGELNRVFSFFFREGLFLTEFFPRILPQ